MAARHPMTGPRPSRAILPVGCPEIAQRMSVAYVSVRKWIERDPTFPKPRWVVGAGPAWCWNRDVAPWLRRTGRL
jgi:hypothetical protein